jgi:hypothetical protein
LGKITTFLWREFRNHGILLAGAAAAAPPALAALHLLHWDFGSAAPVVMLALFAATLASDLIATEIATGRAQALALLPVSPGFIWRAKLLFLGITTAAFSLYLFACDRLLDALLGRASADQHIVASTLADAGMALALAWCAGGVSFFTASLVPHSFGALFAGVFLASGVLWFDMELLRRLDWHGVTATPALLALWLVFEGALFYAASAVLFCWGRMRYGTRLRPIGTGLAAVAFVGVALSGTGASAAVSAAMSIPAEPKEILGMSPSPDGKWIALVSDGQAWGRPRSHYAWILDVDTGALRPVRDTHVWIGGNCWNPDGTVTALRDTPPRVAGEQPKTECLRIDPATGEILNVGNPSRAGDGESQRSWGRVAAANPRSVPGTGRNVWDVTVDWPARGVSQEYASKLPFVAGAAGAILLPRPGRFLGCDETGRLLAYDLEWGGAAVWSEDPVDVLALSPDGTRLLTRRTCKCGRANFDVRDPSSGARLAWGFGEGAVWIDWVPGRADVRLLVLRGPAGRVALHDPDTGATHTFDARPSIELIVALGEKHLAILRADGALDMTDLDGHTIRHLRQ